MYHCKVYPRSDKSLKTKSQWCNKKTTTGRLPPQNPQDKWPGQFHTRVLHHTCSEDPLISHDFWPNSWASYARPVFGASPSVCPVGLWCFRQEGRHSHHYGFIWKGCWKSVKGRSSHSERSLKTWELFLEEFYQSLHKIWPLLIYLPNLIPLNKWKGQSWDQKAQVQCSGY